ncbi:MAG: tRNA (guanosine(46)-N7)-methyltransferase TrmB [Candidatus Cloacimonetes bacterium]|nr:tRNA (guanosine(46)-N7)-methyltransferase TrmB [Candidatus Cloacimonadota bacterium]
MDLSKNRKFFELAINQEKQLDFERIFHNNNEIHLEIGSGRGEFIERISTMYSIINFLGIDLKEKRIKTILRKLDTKNHSNVRLAKIYIDENVTKWIPESSIEKIYLMFPDPWPKKKHNRRRLINANFLNALNKILKVNGLIEITTDHQNYAEWIIDIFKERENFKAVFQNGFTHKIQPNHIETHFEIKKREEGFAPIFMNYLKVREL